MKHPVWTMIPVEPIGQEEATGIGCTLGKGCAPITVTLPVYPPLTPDHERLRDGLRKIPFLLKRIRPLFYMAPMDMMRLRQGEMTLPPDQWEALFRILDAIPEDPDV